MNITDLKHIHFTGIKGVAMTALAICAKELGIIVTGSDVEEEFVTDEKLKKYGITWKTGFSENNLVPKPDLVITTGAHGGLKNPEVLAALENNIKVITHAEALAEFAKGKKIIAVCGVGGKTTTASMIAVILELAGNRPSYAIGVGDISVIGTPGKFVASSEYFVTEADEFAISPGINNNPRFSLLFPDITIVTNIEHDHPDIYPTFEDTKKVFRKFLSQSKSIIANTDNENTRNIVTEEPRAFEGYGKTGNYKIENISYREAKTEFDIVHDSNSVHITLQVPGEHNIYNATAAYIATKQIVGSEVAIEGLQKYTGCKRRLEKTGEKFGTIFYDDYAHHPNQIKQVLKAVTEFYPDKKLLCIFQPHTYSRTKTLWSEFAQAFSDADFVYITDIYSSARETDTLGINSEMLVDEIKKYHNSPDSVVYIKNKEQIKEILNDKLSNNLILLTLGAGDIYKIHKNLLND